MLRWTLAADSCLGLGARYVHSSGCWFLTDIINCNALCTASRLDLSQGSEYRTRHHTGMAWGTSGAADVGGEMWQELLLEHSTREVGGGLVVTKLWALIRGGASLCIKLVKAAGVCRLGTVRAGGFVESNIDGKTRDRAGGNGQEKSTGT
ncbi:hypothetical protein F5Y15DRAFT_373964 [Xylariaceae sp. FL0016]|nr:hypothetical protein F5Y15DRAFT_373964 [Xylariaceae sp. FL0016]